MPDFMADPDAVLDYSIDWSDRLVSGETVSASSWTVPSGITQTTPAPSFTSTTTTIWLTGGTVGQTYSLTNHVTTNQGRQYDKVLSILIAQETSYSATLTPYGPSSLTLGALVEGVLDTLRGLTAQQDSVTALSAGIDAATTSFTVDDVGDIGAGLIEVDTELMRVARVDDATNTVTLQPTGRGRNGTTATTHALGAEVRVQPLVPYNSVIREVTAELGSLYPNLSWIADYEFTYNPTVIAYELPSGVGMVLDVRYKDRLNQWQRVSRWEMEQGQNTSEISSGTVLRLYAPEALSTIRVIYGKPFGRPSALTDNLGTVTGLPSSCEDIIRLGATIRLLTTFDIARLSSITTANAEAAGRSPQPGTGVMVARELRAQYKDRLTTEITAFHKAYPPRSHFTR